MGKGKGGREGRKKKENMKRSKKENEARCPIMKKKKVLQTIVMYVNS